MLCFQIEEGIVLNVAGGLIIEHPLVVPHVKEVVSISLLSLHNSFSESRFQEAQNLVFMVQPYSLPIRASVC